MRIRKGNGIEVEHQSRILIDPRRTERGTVALVSHAHFDHVPRDLRSPKSTVLCTQTTARILAKRYGADCGSMRAVSFLQELEIGGLNITPYIAGHVPGSAMFLIEKDGLRVLYTGDVNPRGGLAVEGPAEVPEADVIIIEATYGRPRFRFPSQDIVRAELVSWAINSVLRGKTPTFTVYPLGKAQEVIAALNKMTDLNVYVTEEVERVNEACRPILELSCSALRKELSGPATVVTGLREVPGLSAAAIAVATGWAIAYKASFAERAFPLSSHGDFDDLVGVIRASGAERVFTVFGFDQDLATYLNRGLGMAASPLGSDWVEI